ncbi:MAG: TonB-dependent Fe(3+) dicitrate receptor FecA [Pseudorhodoferax sp.]
MPTFGSIPFTRAVLASLPLAALSLNPGAALAQPEPAGSTAQAERAYDIPAGPLGAALNRFAVDSGIGWSADASLTQGRQSRELRGRYTLAQGFAQLLEGAGLEAFPRGGNAWGLRAAPRQDGAAEGRTLAGVSVVGNWLTDPTAASVFEHAGARDLVTRDAFQAAGASSAREVLNRIPGVMSPENNGTGSHDMALNFGVRGLNPRLAARSTVLMDGVPVPFAPYGQPQLSFAPISLGNMDSVDVVRGGGAVRYGPQNVGGIVNFSTRAIPKTHAAGVDIQTEASPNAGGNGLKTTTSLMAGGTLDSGLGGVLLYSGVRGGDWRAHSGTQIDDIILKGSYRIDARQKITATAQRYEGEADMPGGLTRAAFDADPYQSTRPKDRFWGHRNMVSAGYEFKPDAQRQFSVLAFYTDTLRSGYLDQGSFVSLSPRSYSVRGIETRFTQGFTAGGMRHEIGVGHRYVSEESEEFRYRVPATSAVLPSESSANDRHTRGETRANAFFIDDRINVGNWTLVPGLRMERIKSGQTNLLNGARDAGSYSPLLPALNVMYYLSDQWNVYASVDSSFGTVQYSKMATAVTSGSVEPEKARSYEIGTRYDSGALRAEVGLFTMTFSNQYESNQTTNSVYARGKTRHVGLEGGLRYDLGAAAPAMKGISAFANYAYVDASILEEGPNKGNQVPFSPRHKAVLGLDYAVGPWKAGVDTSLQSSQFADNANTVQETAAGNNGRIPGYALVGLRASYTFGAEFGRMTLGGGIKNLLDRRYFTRSFDDNNNGIYVGQPRTVYLQLSAAF